MSVDRVVLDHLLRGRAALVREIERLTTAMTQLDGVIERLHAEEPPERADGATPARPAGPARQRVPSPRTPPAGNGQGSRSIRSRILEMMSAEDRDFSLTEVIERIRAAGIQAHDDAIRSITVKLMRDGLVERVGRGQYRYLRESGDVTAPQPEPEAAVEPAAVDGPERYTPPLNLTQPWIGTGS